MTATAPTAAAIPTTLSVVPAGVETAAAPTSTTPTRALAAVSAARRVKRRTVTPRSAGMRRSSSAAPSADLPAGPSSHATELY